MGRWEDLTTRGRLMAIQYSPKVGEILMCDFSKGFIEPEMTKKRPVVIIGTRPNGWKLATVLCISSQAPDKVLNFHMKLNPNHLPNTNFFSNKENWVKGDMVYTVSFERLDYINLGRGGNGKRMYFKNRLSRETMKKIFNCHLNSLGLPILKDTQDGSNCS